MKYPIIAAGVLSTAPAFATTPVLTVYTYDSFVSEWGPGPAVEAAFEQFCECDLKFVGAGDGAALLARLQLEGARTDADVVLGLDNNLAKRALDTGLFAPHGVETDALALPIVWADETFLPFDWGHFAFVYDTTRLTEAPSDFRSLADSDVSILIQDPRSSTPGLGLLLWVKAAYGEDATEIWEGLSDNIVTVTKGWSESYGLFLEGEADMVLSYTTSPAYHLIAEGDSSKSSAAFSEGHYMQIEVAGKVEGSDQPKLSDAFLDFMLSETFQSIIPTTNWMYPVLIPEEGLPAGFETLHAPEVSLIFDAEEAVSVRDQALDEWLTALSR